MNLLDEIRNKLEALKSENFYDSISAAIRHIEVAERHLKRGQNENDEEFNNDVIYRTNQSFEGILKEAYIVLTGNDAIRLSPHQIEQQFLEQQIFTERVFDIFKNYRQNWRNPSTHDHKLLFNEQEALLAIVTISAFAVILLDQIIETVSLKQEHERIRDHKDPIMKKIGDYENLRFDEQILSLINAFNEYSKTTDTTHEELREVEILGRLQGFLSSFDNSVRIMREPIISQDITYRPDLVFEKNNEKIIVEVKRYRRIERVFELSVNQVQIYMETGDFKYGILYFYPTKSEQEFTTIKIQLKLTTKEAYLYVIMPKVRNYLNIVSKMKSKHTEIDVKALTKESKGR